MAFSHTKMLLAAFTLAAVAIHCFGSAGTAQGQTGIPFQVGVVGGVKVDTATILESGYRPIDPATRAILQKGLQGGDQSINENANLRMLSLKGINQQLEECYQQKKLIPVELQFMAGMQRIQYLIVDEKNNDIIIAGPAEGLTTDAFGNVVGAKSGTPALQLEDFLTAMRTSEAARTGHGISVSMDPTPEGIRNLRQFYANYQFRPELVGEVEKAMGEHIITLTGLPKDSRMSQVLVAADYRMKRLAMGLDRSRAAKLPSIIEMSVRAGAVISGAPRMWMECNYEPVATDESNTVFELRGQGVRALTENGYFNRDGKVVVKGQKNKFAETWAKRLTKRFEEISTVEPVFRDLRNVMDMSVVAAIVQRERLLDRLSLSVDAITGDKVKLQSRPVPETLPTQCSFAATGRGYVVTASGGIQLNSWGVAEKTEVVPEIKSVATLAMNRTSNAWWWNAN